MMATYLEDCETAFSLGVIAWIAAIALNADLHLNFTSKEDFIFGFVVTVLTLTWVRLRRWFMRGWASGRL